MKLMHPKHGYHIPISGLERRQLLANGWTEMLEKLATPVVKEEFTVESLRKALDTQKIPYDGRWGIKKLMKAMNGNRS